MTPEERFLILALINAGEAITLFGNLQARGAEFTEYRRVEERLLRAAAALRGEFYAPEAEKLSV